MIQVNSLNKNKNSVFNNNIESENKKKEGKLNCNLKDQANTYSYPIFSDYCNIIKKEEIPEGIINTKNIINGDYDPKGGGSDINCSSTLEIIEYPLTEKPKNIKKQALIETDKLKYDKNIQYYKVPLDIKGDSDDDIYLEEEDFKNRNEKSKYSFQKTHYQNNNYSKTSSFANSELFSDYNNHKKIIVILNNTKKYHQELKAKINNFKKLIYSSKESKLDIVKEYSNKKIKNEISSKNNNKRNKNEKDTLINYTNKNHYLKSYKKENLSKYKNNYWDNSNIKDIPLSDIKIKEKSFNVSNYSNNSTIKSKDAINNILYKKSFKSAINRNENNIKKEKKETNKKSSEIFKLNISSVINNGYQKEKSRINNIKNKNSNYLTFKSNRTSSPEKSKNKKEFNEFKILKNENKITNPENIYDLGHILPYPNQKIKIKNENRIERIKVSNKIDNNNPFREDSNKKDFKPIINKDYIRGKEIIKLSEKYLKKNTDMKSPKQKYIYFSLQTIKE